MENVPGKTQENTDMPRRKSESLEEFQKKNLEKSKLR